MPQVEPEHAQLTTTGHRQARKKGLGLLPHDDLWRTPVQPAIVGSSYEDAGKVSMLLEPRNVDGIARNRRRHESASPARLAAAALLLPVVPSQASHPPRSAGS